MASVLMFMRCTERSLNAVKTVEAKSRLSSMADPVMAMFPGAGGLGYLADSLSDSRN